MGVPQGLTAAPVANCQLLPSKTLKMIQGQNGWYFPLGKTDYKSCVKSLCEELTCRQQSCKNPDWLEQPMDEQEVHSFIFLLLKIFKKKECLVLPDPLPPYNPATLQLDWGSCCTFFPLVSYQYFPGIPCHTCITRMDS